MKPTANQVARAATLAAHVGYTYDELDCQAFVEHCVRQAGGRMDYLGTNDMARRAAWLGTLDEARAQGRLVPGAGLLIREATEANLPARYAGDGLGDFSHVGLYVGENALTDTDKNGRRRACDAVHSSATMGRVAGSTLQNGWTHALWFSEIDYAVTAGAGAGGTSAGAGISGTGTGTNTGGTGSAGTSTGGTSAGNSDAVTGGTGAGNGGTGTGTNTGGTNTGVTGSAGTSTGTSAGISDTVTGVTGTGNGGTGTGTKTGGTSTGGTSASTSGTGTGEVTSGTNADGTSTGSTGTGTSGTGTDTNTGGTSTGNAGAGTGAVTSGTNAGGTSTGAGTGGTGTGAVTSGTNAGNAGAGISGTGTGTNTGGTNTGVTGATPAPGLTAGAVPAAYATVTSPDGGPVKLRKSASRGESLYWLVGAGARVRVERTRDGWSLVTALCTDGYTRRAWMMDAYLRR